MRMNAQNSATRIAPPKGTQLLCENLVNTAFEDLSEVNVELFKDRLLDMTGCIFGGAVVPEDQFLYTFLKRQGGIPEAPLFGDNVRLPLTSAVMHNCIHARANDFGNMYVEIFGEGIASHFGETMIPMGLTLADTYGVSGKELITNNVAAEDCIARILYTMPVRWPTDMQLVSSAAAAVSARYYKLNPEQAKVAFSYAATNATDPGNSYFDYCQEFKFHNGEGARIGILAAEIAKSGSWNGLSDPFFGHWGLIRGKAEDGTGLSSLYEKAFDGLGKVFYTETRFKKGPGGIPTTAAGDCGALLRQKLLDAYGAIDPEEIKAVHVYCTNNLRRNYYENPFRLRSHTNALFSYQFAVCCTLLCGSRRVEQIQTEAIRSNKKLVELTENSTMERYESPSGAQLIKATVEMKNGRCFEAERDYTAAMRDYPTKEFLQEKFWDQFNAFGKLPRSVEELSDVREYTQLLVLQH